MCGRYTLFKLADLLKLIPWLQIPAEILGWQARYHVAPLRREGQGSDLPIDRLSRPAELGEGPLLHLADALLG